MRNSIICLTWIAYSLLIKKNELKLRHQFDNNNNIQSTHREREEISSKNIFKHLQFLIVVLLQSIVSSISALVLFLKCENLS